MASISFSSLIFQHIPHTFSFQPLRCSFKSWASLVPLHGKISDHAVASARTLLSSFLNKLMSARAGVQCQSTPSGNVPWDPPRSMPYCKLLQALFIYWCITWAIVEYCLSAPLKCKLWESRGLFSVHHYMVSTQNSAQYICWMNECQGSK